MSTVSLGMIAVGILVGLVVGIGSVWFDLVPDPQDQVTELRLASADNELTQREAEIERLELIHVLVLLYTIFSYNISIYTLK